MARLTLGRDYDVNETLKQYGTRIEYLERRLLNLEADPWVSVDGGFDTGWVDIVDFEAGFSAAGGSETPQVRRYGPVVAVKGRASHAGVPSDALTLVCTIPSGLALFPPSISEQPRARNQASPVSRLSVEPDGEMQIAGASGETLITLSSVWMVNAPE